MFEEMVCRTAWENSTASYVEKAAFVGLSFDGAFWGIMSERFYV